MKKALSNVHRESWIEAKDKECSSFEERQTYIIPRIPIADIPRDLIIPSKMVFDIKKHPDGSFGKFKCRIVARGDRWKDVYRQDTYAVQLALNLSKLFWLSLQNSICISKVLM